MVKDTKIKHTYIRDGVYYFERRVPKDLHSAYKQPKIVMSLKTKNLEHARRAAAFLTQSLDESWFKLRVDAMGRSDQFLWHKIVAQQTNTEQPNEKCGMTVLEATELYMTLKGHGRPKTFGKAAYRAANYFEEAVGRKTIGQIRRSDAVSFRNYLVGKGLAGSSVVRIFGTFRSILSTAFSEYGVDTQNPLSGLFIDGHIGTTKRKPLPSEALKLLHSKCCDPDNTTKLLLAIILDTGMRLGEAVGLRKSDVDLDAAYPVVHIIPHAMRRLKTRESERVVPLVGMALMAARILLSQNTQSQFLFPAYNKSLQSNANSASATLNKWMKNNSLENYTVHSLRHSFRDRLRAVECPNEVANQLGGWSNPGMGSRYGNDYPLSVLQHWMDAIVQPIKPVAG